MKLEDEWTLPRLRLAWRRINTGRNVGYKRYFRNLYHAYEAGLDENLRDLRSRLKGASYRARPPTRLYLPKPSGLQRPITLLSLEDQVVLQTVANGFARKLQSDRRAVEHEYVFSNILEADEESIFFLQDWRRSYSEFQTRVSDIFSGGYTWIAHFDLAAYYDTICHDLLIRTAFPKTRGDRTLQLVREWLKTWSSERPLGPAHGIPQGPIASDFLAECFLLPVDQALGRSRVNYVRYVDDIRLFAKSENEARMAAIEMELLFRQRGLIPQGKKHAISRAKTLDEAMGILPSIAPPDDTGESGERVLPEQEAVETLRSALDGRPLRIKDKTRARYVLFRAGPSPEILRLVLLLLPRHPEHTDALVHYLSQYSKPSKRIVRTGAEVLRNTPYEYVAGEMWHLLARLIHPRDMGSHIERAIEIAKDSKAGFALKWGALRFLCAADSAGLGNYGRFLMNQESPLLQAVSVPFLPRRRFGPGDVPESLLQRSAPEPGIALAEPFVQWSLTHRNYGIEARSLPRQVRNVFRGLGIVRGSARPADPLGEMLARRYGVSEWDGWKGVFGREYTHAMQLLAIADSAYHIARSQWLSYTNSFNHSLFIALEEYLHAHGLPGAVKITDKHGNLMKFGVLVDASQPFARAYAVIAEGFRDANARRNTLPGSHPYEVKGGAPTRYLRKDEQAKLAKKLVNAYQGVIGLVSPARKKRRSS